MACDWQITNGVQPGIGKFDADTAVRTPDRVATTRRILTIDQQSKLIGNIHRTFDL